MINPMDLTGKTYLITGASSGIGREVCITLSKLGARIALVARNENRLKETVNLMDAPDIHKLVAFDLNLLDKIEEVIKVTVNEVGKFDGFCHCAGLGTTKPLSVTTPAFMEEMMRINLFSFVEITRCLTKKKYCNANMNIVAISSAASIRGDKAKTAYCSTKGALDSAVQALATELGTTKKIRVNSINPAWVNTEIFRNYIEIAGDEKIKEIEEKQFLGVTEPSFIANTVAFLLSDASSAITGQSIIVDGGGTIW